MPEHMPIYMGDKAVEEFVQFCCERGDTRFMLVADENTYRVLGSRVHEAIREQGWDVLDIVFNPEGLHAENISLARTFARYDGQPRTFVGVGSGTITDITRFTSHRSRNPFISFPTAASVDAYASINAPVTIGDLKGSIYCQAPIAIFTDIGTIVESPGWLTASGFGDLTSKFTSASDWKFTKLIWGADFDEDIYRRALAAAKKAADAVDGIAANDPASMEKLMEGQFEGGFCMADFGNSAPASGGEHHIAHIWEMMYHWAGREGLYHGNAVGVAAIIEAGWFEKLRALPKEDARKLLDEFVLPERETQETALRENFPEIAEELIEKEPIFFQLADGKVLAEVKRKILDQWDALQTIAQNVPPADAFRSWQRKLGGPVAPGELGLTMDQAATAVEYGHYLRERFSMNILRKLFEW